MAKRIKRRGKAADKPELTHPRMSREGLKLGEYTHTLYVEGETILRQQGEPIRDCCSSCAFLRGSVPNGCAQTQLDTVKSVMEGKTFLCHMPPSRGHVCAGWFAACQTVRAMEEAGMPPMKTPWPYSPPDQDEKP